MGLTITIYVTDNYLQADQIVTCNPDIESAEVEPDWDFLVLACDGMFKTIVHCPACS